MNSDTVTSENSLYEQRSASQPQQGCSTDTLTQVIKPQHFLRGSGKIYAYSGQLVHFLEDIVKLQCKYPDLTDHDPDRTLISCFFKIRYHNICP